jgi:hypothetical protein
MARDPLESAPFGRQPPIPARRPENDALAHRRMEVGDDRRRRRPRDRFEDDGPPVIGLGDHVPSFLLRPVAPRQAKAVEEFEE